MSLNFRVDKIKNYHENYPDRVEEVNDIVERKLWNHRTEQIVFGCMATGIGELTEETAPEWYARYTIWCQLNGFQRDLDLLPYQDVWQHIGLTTNVCPQESRTKWMKRIVVDRLDRIANANRREETSSVSLKLGSQKSA